MALRNISQIFQDVKHTIPKPAVNIKEIISNLEEYKKVIISRKRTRYEQIFSEFCSLLKENPQDPEQNEKLQSLAASLPNWVHPEVKNYTNEFQLVKTVGTIKNLPFKAADGTDLLKNKDLLKMENLKYFCGEKSYFFTNDLVRLEQALVHYTVEKLLAKGFIPVSVPDILHENMLERCGMATKGEQHQVFRIDPNLFGDGLCLSGTSEMGIAALLMNQNIPEDLLPLNYLAVSRCFRAETSGLVSEKGLYRVTQFTKVEMFGVCQPHKSHEMFETYRNIQEELFSSYDLHYRVIDMAPCELGRQAYRKYDIEAWMPGMNKYGEISSCSNCTDYQSRRMNIRSEKSFLHTVNGTACAIPRTINAIAETHQIEKGRVALPKVLLPYTDIDTVGMKRGPRYNNIKKYYKNLPFISDTTDDKKNS